MQNEPFFSCLGFAPALVLSPWALDLFHQLPKSKLVVNVDLVSVVTGCTSWSGIHCNYMQLFEYRPPLWRLLPNLQGVELGKPQDDLNLVDGIVREMPIACRLQICADILGTNNMCGTNHFCFIAS